MISRRAESHRDGPPFRPPAATLLTSTTILSFWSRRCDASSRVRSNKNRVLWKRETRVFASKEEMEQGWRSFGFSPGLRE